MLIAVADLARQTHLASWNTIWAEDGPVFYAQARSLGLSSITTPYSKYLQLAPRLLALPAAWLPLDQGARYLAASAAIATALSSLAVFHLARTLIRSPWLRAVVAVAPVLVPAAVYEVLANATNVIWPLSCATLWVLLSPITSRRDAILAAFLVALTALSQSLVVIFVPVAVGVLWFRRDRSSAIVVASFLGGLVVQAYVYVVSTGTVPRGPLDATNAAWGYSVHVPGSMLIGDKWLKTAWLDHGHAVGVWAIVVTAVLALVLASQTDRFHLWPGVVVLAYSIVAMAVVTWVHGNPYPGMLPGTWVPFLGSRYTEFTVVLLIGGIALLADGLRRPALRKVVVAVLVAQFTLIAFVGFRAASPRSAGPSWSDALAAAHQKCVRTKQKTVAVSISPPGWLMGVSCSDVH